jgi:hypothetical protein
MDGRLDARSAHHARTVLESAVDDGVGDLVLHVGTSSCGTRWASASWSAYTAVPGVRAAGSS